MIFLGEEKTQKVNVQDVLSLIARCPTGVPKGFAISPTLLNKHINELEDCQEEHGNTDMHGCAGTILWTSETNHLQSALNSFQIWAVVTRLNQAQIKQKIYVHA